jgi:TolA-binding protein
MNIDIRRIRRLKAASTLAVVLALAGPALPAAAQDSQAELRIRKLEAEIRALQRKVFPATAAKPTAIAATPAAASPAPAGATAATDMLKRADELEAQLARLTGQIEQNSNRITQIETRLGINAAAPAAAASEAAAVAAPVSAATATAAPAATAVVAAPAAVVQTAPAKPAAPAVDAPSAQRLAAVRAVVKPQTDDPGDDEYSYGFRLWEARLYPEAEQQLMLFLNKYPKHKRLSWGRNLLGRAYLDEGNPKEAAKWFLENYQSDKRGDRAPDSLLYLAESMKRLKDTKRACIALAEFADTYAAEAADRLKGTYDATRNGLTCG